MFKKQANVNNTLISMFSDLGRIQTCNLLSRNQMHYSVMLRGLSKLKYFKKKNKINQCCNLIKFLTVSVRIYYNIFNNLNRWVVLKLNLSLFVYH